MGSWWSRARGKAAVAAERAIVESGSIAGRVASSKAGTVINEVVTPQAKKGAELGMQVMGRAAAGAVTGALLGAGGIALDSTAQRQRRSADQSEGILRMAIAGSVMGAVGGKAIGFGMLGAGIGAVAGYNSDTGLASGMGTGALLGASYGSILRGLNYLSEKAPAGLKAAGEAAANARNKVSQSAAVVMYGEDKAQFSDVLSLGLLNRDSVRGPLLKSDTDLDIVRGVGSKNRRWLRSSSTAPVYNDIYGSIDATKLEEVTNSLPSIPTEADVLAINRSNRSRRGWETRRANAEAQAVIDAQEQAREQARREKARAYNTRRRERRRMQREGTASLEQRFTSGRSRIVLDPSDLLTMGN